MIGRFVTVILLSTVSLIETIDVPHLMSFAVAELGDTVTLQCRLPNTYHQLCYWHKQALGYMTQTVSSQTYDKSTIYGQFNNTRFTVVKEADEYNLTIRNVRKEDEATYFCAVGTSYAMNYPNATFLAVNDYTHQRLVYQRPVTESVQLGDSVTLQCSILSKRKENRNQCPGEHNVYWISVGSADSRPGVIYTHWNWSTECEESHFPQKSCVYRLFKNIKSSSDAGTYYCAVVTCGEILFGNGTKLDIRPTFPAVVIVLGILLACCVIVIAILIFSRNHKRVCEHCKGTVSASNHLRHDEAGTDQPSNLDGEAETLNYAPLDFSARKAKGGRKKREMPQETVYSAIKTDRQ